LEHLRHAIEALMIGPKQPQNRLLVPKGSFHL
jgi:hypothetical protein